MKLVFLFLAIVLLLGESTAFWSKKKKKTATAPSKLCKKGWSLYEWHCYNVFKIRRSFKSAEYACRKEGGHLASITSHKEFSYLHSLIKKVTYRGKPIYVAWIGLKLDESKKPPRMIWTDGSVTKYRPPILGTLRSWGRLWRKNKIETLTLYRCRRRGQGVAPKSSFWRLYYVCKSEASVCPKGWSTLNKKCYKFYSKPQLTFNDAEKYCNKKGGHLTSLHSPKEYAFVMGLIRIKKGTNQAWTGVILNHKKKAFKWTDGSKADYSPKDAKIDNKPKGADVARLIYHNGKAVGLYDTIRAKKYGFICKKGNNLPTTTTTTTTTTTARTFI